MKRFVRKEISNPLRIVVIASAMLLISLWALDAEEKRAPAQTAQSSEEPDFYMSAVDSIEFDEDGRREMRMQAEEMSHYPHNDITAIARPEIDILTSGGKPYRISAHYGQVFPGGDEVELRGRVNVQMVGEGKSTGELRTESLRVFLEREYVETSEAVTIISAYGKTVAKGLQADLKTSRIKLLAQVRGRYDGKMFKR